MATDGPYSVLHDSLDSFKPAQTDLILTKNRHDRLSCEVAKIQKGFPGTGDFYLSLRFIPTNQLEIDFRSKMQKLVL